MTSRSTEPTAKKPRRVLVEKAADADDVLSKCRELRQELSTKISTKNIAAKDLPDSVPSNIQEVEELTTTEVLEGIEAVALGITSQVLAKQGFNFEVPSRASSNQLYIKEWDRIVLGGKRSTRSFMNVKESRKSAVTLRAMSLIHAVLSKRIHITKRDLFYTDVKLFVDQAESDGVLDDIATMIGCTRSNLHVVASDKGLVVGRIQFEEDGDPIDCTRMGVGGKAIPVSYMAFVIFPSWPLPSRDTHECRCLISIFSSLARKPYIDKIENIRSDAEFVLLVEKEAAYMRMAVSGCKFTVHES
jgi:meiotic recombination protein SPO11